MSSFLLIICRAVDILRCRILCDDRGCPNILGYKFCTHSSLSDEDNGIRAASVSSKFSYIFNLSIYDCSSLAFAV
ncbi:hypothetical protein BJ912DRAFT_176780 [Pholiota molesta]|nr:hypothetical protein BJ912DRAFT_176780 [Pholiota molesta]